MKRLSKSILFSLGLTLAAALATPVQAQPPEADKHAVTKPRFERGVAVKVSGSPYVDIAANFGAIPATLNYRGKSYLVFTPLPFTSLSDLRAQTAARNTTVQFGNGVDLETVRRIENFVSQLYGADALLDSAIENSLILTKAGDELAQQRDLASFGVPSGLSTISRYRFFQTQMNEPIADLDNRQRRGGVVFETVRIRPPLVR